MIEREISDWDDAYANAPNIAGGERWPAAWAAPAREYRERMAEEGQAELDAAYGEAARNRLDLFQPEGEARGLVVFVHGGFWQRLDKSYWSHLAAGAVARGMAVAMPSYTLCPQARITQITREIGQAISFAAARVGGPVFLAGHSAGGHLVTRMICRDSPLAPEVLARVQRTVSISGVHDLRPLLKTRLNDALKLDEAEAETESPALLKPVPRARLICWVGAGERAEFIRQNALLANVWTGLGARTAAVEEPDRHHFNVIDGLADPEHPLTRALLTA